MPLGLGLIPRLCLPLICSFGCVFWFFFFLTTQKNKDLEEGCKLPVHLGHTFLGTVLPTLGIPSCLRVEAVGDCG